MDRFDIYDRNLSLSHKNLNYRRPERQNREDQQKKRDKNSLHELSGEVKYSAYHFHFHFLE